jgi:enoyl-CoA hydratase
MTDQIERMISRKADGIGWMFFNDPKAMNAISMEMSAAIPRIMAAHDADPEVRVIIVAGMGERAFAAGSNISAFGKVRTDAAQNRAYHELNERSYNSVYECSKPTIAMIRGYCMGGGLDYASSCDIRIAGDDAVFAIPAARLGLGYGYQGQVRLNRLIGPAQARDLFFSARRYNAAEALRTGLVHEVVPAAELEARTLEYAKTIAANAPLTLKAIKKAFLELEKSESQRDMGKAQALIDACYASKDYLEGREAFAVKRKPAFIGE